MSPPPSRRTPLDPETLRPRGRHQRALRRRRRRKGAVVAVTAIVALAAAAGMGGTAAVVAYGSSCDLDSLQSVDIGTNSFVYAADGSLLGSIPAERNREPVTAADMSLWIRKATHRDRGPPLLRARRRRRRGHRARSGREPPRRRDRRGRVDDHAAARAEPLHLEGADGSAQGEGGVPGDEARPRADEAVDPDLVSEPELLRESRVRHRGGRADLLLEAGQGSHALRGGAPRGPAAGAVDPRSVHGSRARARAAAGGAAGDAGHGRHHAAHLPQGRRRAARTSTRPALRRDPRALLLRLRPRQADRGLRRAASPRRAVSRSTRRSSRATRGSRRHRSATRSTSRTIRPRR